MVPGVDTRGPWSLRRRLVAITVIATMSAWLIGGMATFAVARNLSETLFDERLRDFAGALLAFVGHEIEEASEGGVETSQRFNRKPLGGRYRYQVWSDKGELLIASTGTPTTPMTPLEEAGFSTRVVGADRLRVFLLASQDGSQRLEVAEPISGRLAWLDSRLSFLFVAPVLTLIALVVLGAWFVRRATRDLSESARQLKQRSPQDLRPLTLADPPEELVPILAAVNSLLDRTANALVAERRFTSAAAHELRTPLATIRIQAQVANLTASESDRRRALEELIQSIDRTARMVDQLLTMSRIDGLLALRAEAVRLRLDGIAEHVIEEERLAAARRKQTIEAELEPAEMDGLEFAVASMMRNLIDNAVQHGPVGGIVRVRAGPRDGRCFFSVSDAGPGIAPEQRARVFERFARLQSDRATDGCGIGLSIVQTVVLMHEGRIELDTSSQGGLLVTVSFASSLAPLAEDGESSRLRPLSH